MNEYPTIYTIPSSEYQQSSRSVKPVPENDNREFPRIQQYITYEEFFSKYLLPNIPCIFGSYVTRDWRCRNDWVKADGTPNFDFIKDKFGDVKVPIADCGQQEYSSHRKEDMKLCDYIDYMYKYKNCGYHKDERCLYLKDWHFTRDFPDYAAYKTPVYFSSDWLNEFWDVRDDIEDDYRFVYIGPRGSWTSFHADVFRSFSWSANICGRKKWIFYPPGEENNLKDKFGNLIYDVTEPIDESKYFNASQVKQKYEIIQESGEIIFVPSGWHHQVINMEDTISVNHNWLNGCCIDKSWNFIKSSLLEVEKEISDCLEMENWNQQCQLILKASSGINFMEFYHFMATIASHRMNELEKQPETMTMSEKCTSITASNNITKSNSHNSYQLHIDGQMDESVCKADCSHNSRVTKHQQKHVDDHNTMTSCLHTSERSSCDELCGKLDLCSNTHLQDTGDNKCHWRYLNVNHAMFDLCRVKDIVSDILRQPVFHILTAEKETIKESCGVIVKVKQLLSEINGMVDNFS